MKRRPRATAPSGATGISKSLCLALVLVDGARIRHQIKGEYEKAQKKLEQARRHLERFQTEDLPQFTRWLHGTFGAILTDLRELTRQIAEAEDLINEIQQEVFFTATSFPAAYRRVMHRRRHPSAAGPEEDDPFQTGESELGHDNQYGGADEDDLFDEFDRVFAETFRFRSRGRRRRARTPSPPSAPPTRTRLKALYRALVRRLHPDAQTGLTPRKLEWWHQVQAAYEKGDQEQMEVILALCEIEETGHTDATSLSLLQRITRQLKTALREANRQLKKHRADPAWDFSRRQDRARLQAQTRSRLEEDRCCLTRLLQEFESILEGWRREPQRRRSRRRSRPEPFVEDLEFFY